MLDFLKSLVLRPRCPKCGHSPLERQRRTGPIPAGRDPCHVYACPKCGAVVDLPAHLLMKLCQ